MPPAEVSLTIEDVHQLVSSQAPQFADQEITPLAEGWDNLIFRLGTERLVRLPRREIGAALLENEVTWLAKVAGDLPLRVPVAEFVGEPTANYPWRWTVVPYLRGVPGDEAGPLSESAGEQFASFFSALHVPATNEMPVNPFRGVPLSDRAPFAREQIDQLGDVIDGASALSVLERAMSAPAPSERTLIHGDPHPANLLVDEGRLSGIIDFGDMCAGDPATDLAGLFMLDGIDVVAALDQYGADEAMRLRAAGWAAHFAVMFVAVGRTDRPSYLGIGHRTLERLAQWA